MARVQYTCSRWQFSSWWGLQQSLASLHDGMGPQIGPLGRLRVKKFPRIVFGIIHEGGPSPLVSQ